MVTGEAVGFPHSPPLRAYFGPLLRPGSVSATPLLSSLPQNAYILEKLNLVLKEKKKKILSKKHKEGAGEKKKRK